MIIVELTDAQRATLFMLVRNEAIALGWGTEYIEGKYQHMHPHHGWPRRLKHLSTLAGKLHKHAPLDEYVARLNAGEAEI